MINLRGHVRKKKRKKGIKLNERRSKVFVVPREEAIDFTKLYRGRGERAT